MKTNLKKVLSITVLAICGSANWAADPVTEAYLRGNEPRLNAQEKAAVDLAREWRSSDYSSKPIKGTDGSVRYYYGFSQPVMICAPLEVCVIKLQSGEVITALEAGDKVRWIITPIVIGTSSGENQSEVIIKPTQVGLLSSLYIGTNRRSYHIKLKSSRTEFISKMSFIYPKEFNQSWDKYQQIASIKRQRESLPESAAGVGRHIEELDFDYKIKGKAKWKPVRVYNDGVRTIIQMPDTLHQTSAPVLLVLDEHNDEKLVNSRLKGNAFIVDKVFSKAVLIAGVGGNQTRVVIEKL